MPHHTSNHTQPDTFFQRIAHRSEGGDKEIEGTAQIEMTT